MNSDSQRLLEDLLEEAAPASFRSFLLNETLDRARKRRRVRIVSRSLITAALLIGLPWLFWKGPASAPTLPKGVAYVTASASASYNLIRTQPLSQSALVETIPGATPLFSSASGNLGVVETKPGKQLFKQLTDDELLALMAGRPGALVRPAPGQAELLFSDSDDHQSVQLQ